MGGELGHNAWYWLFFIEEAITMAVAVLAIFILPDFPSTTSWLSPMERRLAEVRMALHPRLWEAGSNLTQRTLVVKADNDTKEEGAFYGLILAAKDSKVWWLALALTAQVVGLRFGAYFPTLTATLGYNRTTSLLLCAPSWAFATIFAFINARHADKTSERF